jgi:hypothetical protein
MANSTWDDEDTMPNASDYYAAQCWQPNLAQEAPSFPGLRPTLDNTASLLAGAMGAGSDINTNESLEWMMDFIQTPPGNGAEDVDTTAPSTNIASGQGELDISGTEGMAPFGSEYNGQTFTPYKSFQPSRINFNNASLPADAYRHPVPTFNIVHYGGTSEGEQQGEYGAAATSPDYNPLESLIRHEPGAVTGQHAMNNNHPVHHPQWAQETVDHLDQTQTQKRGDYTHAQNSGAFPHSPPWNPLVLRGGQEFEATQPTCNCSGSSSRVPTATDFSLSSPSRDWTSTTLSGSEYRNVMGSMGTVQPRLTSGSLDRLQQEPHHGPSDYSPTGYHANPEFGSANPHSGRELQSPRTMEDSRLVVTSLAADDAC